MQQHSYAQKLNSW